jgi:branched-chain amino acid transport system substrate-binding protein
MRRLFLSIAVLSAITTLPGMAYSQKRYDSGASDTIIKIGTVAPYSGPASAYGAIAKTLEAYFKKVNAEGGIQGRTIQFIALDDGYNPARTLEQTRRLVEQEQVLLIFQTLGTAPNNAIHTYLNQNKIPHLFVASGASKWGDPARFPWTMGWHLNYRAEAQAYAQHILANNPQARIAILMQNDDYGRDYLEGLRAGLGDKAARMIVKTLTYELSDPTIESQIIELKASGADTFFNIATPKFAAQAIRKAAEIGWRPTHYLNSVSNAAGSVMGAAGAQHGIGVISAFYQKDPTDPQWQNTPEYQAWLSFMRTYHPQGDLQDNFCVYGYSVAQTLVHVLKQAGDTLTRENIMRQAAQMDLTLPMLLPGVNVRTRPDDFFPIERARLARWNGTSWVLFGEAIGR